MNETLERDLERWEAGAISSGEIQALHPGVDVASLIELHEELTLLSREPTPDAGPGWEQIRGRLPIPLAGAAVIDPPTRRSKRALTRRRVAVLGLAAALTLTGGLAAAGVLPQPAQDAIASVADHLGLHLPNSTEPPDNTSQGPDNAFHGREVSETARSDSSRGCEKGRAVSAVASAGAKGAGHAVDRPDPCQTTAGGGGGGHGSRGRPDSPGKSGTQAGGPDSRGDGVSAGRP